MQTKPSSMVDCRSCGAANSSGLAFCTQCGKALSSNLDTQRQVQGVKKRPCDSCGKADELNNRYCVFCGAEIDLFKGRATSSEALARFTSDLANIKDAQKLATRSYSSLPAAELKAQEAQSLSGKSPVKESPARDFSIALGLVAGLALPFLIGQGMLNEVVFPIVAQAPADGLMLLTEKPFVSVVVEDSERAAYTLGQSSKKGVLAVPSISGDFNLKLALPGFKTVLAPLKLPKGKLTVIGFDKRVSLPRATGGN